MIRFSHVNKTYSPRWTVLKDLSFYIKKGEFVCLNGPSGSGKSTIIRLIIMEELPTSGEVTVLEYKSSNVSQKRISALRCELGVIFQDFKLLEDRSVFENIAFPLQLRGIRSKTVKERVLRVITDVGLNHKMYAFPQTLSASEKQKCCMARALINNPNAILADEPTGNLDKASAGGILNLFRKINTQGTTVLFTTHNIDLARQFRGRVITLDQGRITSQ